MKAFQVVSMAALAAVALTVAVRAAESLIHALVIPALVAGIQPSTNAGAS